MSNIDPTTGLPVGIGGGGNPYGTAAQLKAAWLAEQQRLADVENKRRLEDFMGASGNWLAGAVQAMANGHTPGSAPAPPPKQVLDTIGEHVDAPWPGLLAPVLPLPTGNPSGQVPVGFMGIGLASPPTLRDVLDAVEALDAKVERLLKAGA